MFNHNTLEQDIKRLSREVAEKMKRSEHKDLSEKEIIKQVIESAIKESAVASEITSSLAVSDEDSVLPPYLKDSPAELKLAVEKLVDAVFHKGLAKAVNQAKKAGDFVLDAFHDALAGRLYDELKKRKMI